MILSFHQPKQNAHSYKFTKCNFFSIPVFFFFLPSKSVHNLIPPHRYALQDMDKFSLKDSGRGDSEAGDSDCDMGRESPVDRLLMGEGFSDLIHLEMHRLHPGEPQPDPMKLIRSHSVLRTASCRFHMPPEPPAAFPASQISAPRTASHLSPIICLYTCLSRRSAQPVAYTIPIVLGAHSSAQPSFQHLLSQ